jgi:hypothetical protein
LLSVEWTSNKDQNDSIILDVKRRTCARKTDTVEPIILRVFASCCVLGMCLALVKPLDFLLIIQGASNDKVTEKEILNHIPLPVFLHLL